MKKLFLTLFLLGSVYVFGQTDSTMFQIQGQATIADNDIVIVGRATDSLYFKITYAQLKTLLSALYISSIDSANLPANTITEVHLKVTNTPTDNYVLSYDDASKSFTWAQDATGGAPDSAIYLTVYSASQSYQPLEATLTDIADGTIAENLVNTTNPWAENELVSTMATETEAIQYAIIVRDSLVITVTLPSGAFIMGNLGSGWYEATTRQVRDTLNILSGQTVGGSNGDLVVLTSASTWSQADADTLANSAGMLGIRISATQVLLRGEYTTTGLTAAATYYMSTTAGAITTTAPTTATDIVRIIGYAISTTEFYFDPDKTYLVNN